MAPPTLSSDLLHEIVGIVVAQYIDDLLAGPLKYTKPSGIVANGAAGPSQRDPTITEVANSPCVALMQSSYQLRKATMSMLCRALEVEYEPNGVGRQVLPG